MKKIKVYRDDTLLWEKVMVASSFFSRLVGLLNRSSLESSEGMFFKQAPAIHTIGMRFPIDVLFLDASRRVAKVLQQVKPNRILPYIKSQYTIELTAGQSEEKKIQPGETLRWEEGQVLLEYALIISVFVITIVILFPSFASNVSDYMHDLIDFVLDL